MGFPSLSETFQLVRALRQASPDGDSLTPSDWPVMGHSPAADRVLARSSDLWRAFTLPEYSARTKKEYGRLLPSANAVILGIGRFITTYHYLTVRAVNPRVGRYRDGKESARVLCAAVDSFANCEKRETL